MTPAPERPDHVHIFNEPRYFLDGDRQIVDYRCSECFLPENHPHEVSKAAAPVTDAGLRAIAAMLDDELRRVEAGYSTLESLRRARATYAAALSRRAEKETA